MATLHPPQSSVSLYVFTLAGWTHGVLHLPVVQDLLSYLNSKVEMLKLTDVMLPGSKQPQPFLALHKSAALLVIPHEVASRPGGLGVISQGHHPVTCLLSQGSVFGYLKRPKDMRTSDLLLHSSGFIELLQCHLGSTSTVDLASAEDRTWPQVLVNAKGILGVTEQSQ